MKYALILTTFCVVVAHANPASLGDLVSVGSSKDNTLYEDPAGALSNGAGNHFFAGRISPGGGGLIRRGLLHFDIAAAIPSGSTITSVTLTLNMSRTIAADQDVSLHLATADWGEGTSVAPFNEGGGALATAGDATWLHTFFPGSFWSSAGGDFNPLASATQSVGDVGFYSWNSAAMVADVQSWLDNATGNFGWVVIGNESSALTAKRFDSHENPTPANRPTLLIEFTPIPEPASGFLCTLGLMALASRRRRPIR